MATGLARRLAVDVPLAVLLGAMLLAATHGQAFGGGPWRPPCGPCGPHPPGGPGPLELAPAAVGCVVAAAGALAVRRVWPHVAFAVSVLAVTGYLTLGYRFGPILVTVLITLFSLAAAMPVRRWAPWAALLVPLFAAALLRAGERMPSGDVLVAAFAALLVLAAPAALGVLARLRRESVRREREQELRRSAYEERLRIAREVHDLVGHSLSVIHMQAGVALHVLPRRPEQAAPSLEAIRQTSKDALEELRGTLAVFRAPDGAEPPADRAPLPGLRRLDDLVAAVTAAGRTATVRTEGGPARLPSAVDHAAYRIVQEALTNVVRHAGGAGAEVRLAYRDADVLVEVTDDGPARPDAPPAEGSGIAGMRERARAVGGRLQAGPRPGGGFAVRAELPLRGHGGAAARRGTASDEADAAGRVRDGEEAP
ncbi:sensor histidine kinase [Marinactinospora rubrisoli]|uniref:histidine kinase n=1 Tax=Marinactinospora rubrisoli TaxID=2715399 RepID=A0ABW2KKQ1_9ACTN